MEQNLILCIAVGLVGEGVSQFDRDISRMPLKLRSAKPMGQFVYLKYTV